MPASTVNWLASRTFREPVHQRAPPGGTMTIHLTRFFIASPPKAAASMRARNPAGRRPPRDEAAPQRDSASLTPKPSSSVPPRRFSQRVAVGLARRRSAKTWVSATTMAP